MEPIIYQTTIAPDLNTKSFRGIVKNKTTGQVLFTSSPQASPQAAVRAASTFLTEKQEVQQTVVVTPPKKTKRGGLKKLKGCCGH